MKNKFQYLIPIIKPFLFLAFIITVIFLTIYTAVQQDLRLSANDPQIQLAQDYSQALSSGRPFSSIISGNRTDVASSLAPFAIIFDQNGKVISSSAVLNGKTPTLPKGVLDAAKQTKGENRITWQPKSGVRLAIVVKYFSKDQAGFILVGRSLREVEKRETNLGYFVLLGWLMSILGALVAVILSNKKLKLFK